MRNLLACHLSGQARGTLYPVRAAGLIRELSTLPGLAGQLLKDAWRGDRYRQLAKRFLTTAPLADLLGAMHGVAAM